MFKLMNSKALSIILSVAMVFGALAGMTVVSSADTITYTEISSLSGITSMSGNYKLTADVTIDASTWTPIGTSSAPFTGKFDGGNHTITWSGSATGSSYYGVFGSSSGIIANVNLAGSLTLTGTSGSYVSPLVGYSTGSVYNCQSDVDFTAEKMDNAGGIVGAIENLSTSSSPIYIEYCGNTGNITALKRVGGVVGAVYCSVQGNCIVDQCYSKSCTIYTKNTSSKVWSGGLAGYVKGAITNCYTDGITLHASGGHYLSGLVGILNGSSPSAYATNCYSNVAAYTNCATGYDRPFVGSVDSSSSVVLTNCYFTQSVSGYTQPTTTSGTWGTWTGGGLTSDLTNISIGDEFTLSSSSNPTLDWENETGFSYSIANGTAGGTTTGEVHLGGSSTYQDLSSAITAAGSSGTIIVDSTIEIESALNLYDNVTIKRGNATGALFKINSGSSTVRLTTMTVDGNGSGTLFEVTGGTLQLRGNITLQNCATAVLVNGGTLEVNKASITANTRSVDLQSGSFILNDFGDTSISGTVYLGSGAYITTQSAIPCALTVSMETATGYPTIVKGSGYTLQDSDILKIISTQGDVALENNEIYLNVGVE